MTSEVIENNENVRVLNNINITARILILIFSLLSIIFDILSALILLIHYCFQGQTSWAIITFSFIFFPSVVIQILSTKFYLASSNMMITQWVLHSLLLGVIYRYIRAIKKCMTSYKSKSNFNSDLLASDINNLKNLYLFKSFLECGPQLIFQLYILGLIHDYFLLTAFSAVTSAFSIAWALVLHMNAKKGCTWPGLACLILWRAGMISARISALVVCLYICGPWIILFIGSHWLAMTLWITYQKTAEDDREEKEEFNSTLYGVIYCFCFFPLKPGQSQFKAIIFDFLLVFENLVFLTVFLMQFSAKSPKLAIFSFVIVVFGNILGMLSFLLFNTFFNETGSSGPARCRGTTESLINGRIRLLNLIRKKKETDSRCIGMPTCESEHLKDVQSPSDSVIIIEEDQASHPEQEEKAYSVATATDISENIYDLPDSNKEEESNVAKLSAAFKRRAVCSSVDLSRFHDKNIEDLEIESNLSSKAVSTDEPPSEILSAHDYENLCAVNIAREPWGIRSWRGYSDIETLRHDDSVFNERKLDNLTTSSEYSVKIEDRDSVNTLEDDLVHCDVESNSDKTSVNFRPPMPVSMLHTIFEEREGSLGGTNVDGIKGKCKSESALVATIDKICLYTPLRTRCGSVDRYEDIPQPERMPGKENKDPVKNDPKRVKRKISVDAEKDSVPSVKGRINPVQKLTLFKERFETNRYQISGGNLSPSPHVSASPKRNMTTSVGDSSPNNIGKTENERIKKRFTFKGKSNFLMQVLTPSRLEKRKFQVSPPTR